MMGYICKGRNLCRNESCLYRKAHTKHNNRECLPFYCIHLRDNQHCEPVKKGGIMEDNRKGTWEDVTGECTVDLSQEEKGTVNVRYPGREIRLVLNGHGMEPWAAQGGVDFVTEQYQDEAKSYRVVVNSKSGSFTVEHFIPDPEPVIAYKAVIEVDGEWVSTWAGGPCAGDLERLSYAVDRIVTATKGPGVACFTNLELARVAFPSPISKGGKGTIPRNHGRLGILEVQIIGVGAPSPNVFDAESRGAYCYPSVKVLSVAWEEEKKEEWVDVTKECVASLYRASDDSASCVQVHHNGRKMVWFGGDKPYVHSNYNYRVTFSTDGPLAAGEFKVEKRND